MKRMILSIAVCFLAAGAWAQTTGSNAGNSTSVSTTKNTTTKSKKSTKAVKSKTTDINNRKIYKGKDGQRATPTGHEATPINGGYSSLKTKDTTAAKKQED